MGERGPQPKKAKDRFTKRNVSFPPGLEKKLMTLAKRAGVPFSTYIAGILGRAVKRRERRG